MENCAGKRVVARKNAAPRALYLWTWFSIELTNEETGKFSPPAKRRSFQINERDKAMNKMQTKMLGGTIRK